MSILQVMNDSLTSDAPAYMEFLYRYNPKKSQAFVFYEGDEDASYYHRFLEQSLGAGYDLEEIVAGSKYNVLKIQREFDWQNYNEKQIVFFVDRDLSFWLKEEPNDSSNIYVTDNYSVENYVVNPRIFRIWLQMFKGFARAQKTEIENMVNEYIALETQFIDMMIPTMARSIVAKRHNGLIHLKEYNFRKGLHMCVENSRIAITYSEDLTCYEKWGVTSQHDEEVNHQIEIIKNNREHFSVRGKWLLYFMAEVGEIMRIHANHFAPSLMSEGKIPVTCSIASSQCLPALAPYCNTPPCSLAIFLANTFCSFVEDQACS